MKILVVGGGGREHALAWKLAQSPRVREVIVAPGNAGTALEPRTRNASVAATDIDGLLALAQSEDVALTVVGPEAPLAAGIVDRFQDAGLRCFGPGAQAAQLEASKAFSKEFMTRHGIATASYAVFDKLEPALIHVGRQGVPIVVKADGLAAGKGVTVAKTLSQAEAAVRACFDGQFGQAGARVVIEDMVSGEEASYIVIADGDRFQALASSQDHKRLGEADTGPNTGGMGAYSPTSLITPALAERIEQDIIAPALAGLEAEGRRFTGFLYAGLMIDEDGTPRVLEFNVRLGDPETQPILMRLRSDLVDLIEATLEGAPEQHIAEWDERPALGIVMASAGYPGQARSGDPILGLDSLPDDPDIKVFHGATGSNRMGDTVTAGGRVLTVCALGKDIAGARGLAVNTANSITFEGAQFRNDIGWRAIIRGLGDLLA